VCMCVLAYVQAYVLHTCVCAGVHVGIYTACMCVDVVRVMLLSCKRSSPVGQYSCG